MAGSITKADVHAGLFALSSDTWYVALGRCGPSNEGIYASKVNTEVSNSLCFSPAQPAPGSDSATKDSLADVGTMGGMQMIRLASGASSPAMVQQIFSLIAPPANPLELPVDRLSYFQGTASGCSGNAIFSFTKVNKGGVQRGWGERDVRVNPVYDLPEGWTIDDLRHEVLYEQATFRGMVERPTFDILHPWAERPLLITVFDLLPATRSSDRCPTTQAIR